MDSDFQAVGGNPAALFTGSMYLANTVSSCWLRGYRRKHSRGGAHFFGRRFFLVDFLAGTGGFPFFSASLTASSQLPGMTRVSGLGPRLEGRSSEAGFGVMDSIAT